MHLLSANQSISYSMTENYEEDNPDNEEKMNVFHNIYFVHRTFFKCWFASSILKCIYNATWNNS